MGLFFNKSYNIIGVILSNDNIILNCINLKNDIFEVKAYQEIILDSNQFFNLNILNSSDIIKFIQEFLTINNLIKNNLLAICLDSDNLQELITENINENILNKFQNYCLAQEELIFKNKKTLYSCALKPENIFQLKLLSCKLKLDLITITTSFIAKYYAYKYNDSNNFNFLSNNFEELNNYLTKTNFENIKIKSNFNIPKENIAKIIGLYLVGKRSYEAA